MGLVKTQFLVQQLWDGERGSAFFTSFGGSVVAGPLAAFGLASFFVTILFFLPVC